MIKSLLSSISGNESVTHKVLGMSQYKSSHCIALYYSTPSEISTLELINASIEAGKKVLLPTYKGKTMKMVRVSREEFGKLEANRYGIKQPDFEGLDESQSVDFVVAPGVAFDSDCNRLGHGGGYYDRWFKSFPTRPYTVGIGFDCQVVEKVHVDEWDVKLDAVVTPSNTFTKKYTKKVIKRSLDFAAADRLAEPQKDFAAFHHSAFGSN